MSDRIALYHRIIRRENFEKAAEDLFGLLKSAQAKYPNQERVLYVDINEDYKSACAFVHGQDMASKMMLFTFYDSICYHFERMMRYIFRTIRLFPLNESLEDKLADLEDGLGVLLEKYCC